MTGMIDARHHLIPEARKSDTADGVAGIWRQNIVY